MRKLTCVLLAAMLSLCLFHPSALADSPIFPADLTEIADYAFYQDTSLTGSLVIPATVRHIGAHAFDGCTGLTYRSLPDGITVDPTAFDNTNLLTNRDLRGELVIYTSIYPFALDMLNDALKKEFPNLTPGDDGSFFFYGGANSLAA